jgi:glucose-1-phosphate cytidylyltransferase
MLPRRKALAAHAIPASARDNARPVPHRKPTVVILCGGRGTRLAEHSSSVPKPLVEIGGRPIVWHVISLYLAHGFRRFLLLTGYLGGQVESFVAGESWPEDADIRCLHTGLDTPTGGRVHRAAGELVEPRFCLAYADGVADIDLTALLDHHTEHGASATMAVVQPRLPFGVAELGADGCVHGFSEKPRSELWVNAGFFCFERSALEVLGPDSVLERAPLERLAQNGQLRAFRHRGFWQCMDTYKDAITLNEMWLQGCAPWKVWG